MKKTFLAALAGVLLFGSCAKEFNSVYKSSDYKYKYEYAKECFANGKYSRAAIILQEVIVPLKGSVDAQECLYMLGMAEYMNMDYERRRRRSRSMSRRIPADSLQRWPNFTSGRAFT